MVQEITPAVVFLVGGFAEARMEGAGTLRERKKHARRLQPSAKAKYRPQVVLEYAPGGGLDGRRDR